MLCLALFPLVSLGYIEAAGFGADGMYGSHLGYGYSNLAQNYQYYPYQQLYGFSSYMQRARAYNAYSDLLKTKLKSLKSGGGYGHSSAHSYVTKTKKKKQKIISIDKGMHVPGGTQAFGKFKSLKSCMKACAVSPNCFAGDYNPWLGRCYFHSNQTACSTMATHSKLTHFKKIPCTVPDTTNSQINLGSQLFGGILQKGLTSLADCLKKCANAGSGIASQGTDLASFNTGGQLCFGFDYDFASHKCYFHTRLWTRTTVVGANTRVTLPLCPVTNGATIPRPLDLTPNPSVVNILLCPP